jgi:hypothetical protein
MAIPYRQNRVQNEARHLEFHFQTVNDGDICR